MKDDLRTDNVRTKAVLVPFLVGGLVGAGVMLLLAPKTGKEMRRDIADLAADSRERIVSGLDKGRALIEKSGSVLSEAIEAGKTAYTREKEKYLQAA